MMALQSGSLGPDDFSNQIYLTEERQQLTKRATVQAFKVDSQFKEMSPDYPDMVSVKLKNGSMMKESIGYVKGGFHNPMSLEDLRNKFQKCSNKSTFFDQFLSAPIEANSSSLLDIF